jgi:hypothetical protein
MRGIVRSAYDTRFCTSSGEVTFNVAAALQIASAAPRLYRRTLGREDS